MTPAAAPADKGVDSARPAQASFVPLLDARQRALLAEMGIRVWAPQSAPTPTTAAALPLQQAVPAPAPAAGARARPAATPAPVPERGVVPTLQPLAAGIGSMDWSALRQTVAACQACGLCVGRKNTVFGSGAEQADWMFVGEPPTEEEDLQGEPFVGAAGTLLDNMLRAVGVSRGAALAQAAYLTGVLKCRPPASRNPEPAELAQCAPYLARQVALLQPKVIVAMGRFAVQALLGSTEPMGRLRGRVHHYQGVPLIVTYHPAFLLRSPGDKAKAWADLCLALEQISGPAS